MSCEHVQKSIPDFLKGSLTRSEEDEILNHLNLCVTCRFVYQDIRQQMQEEADANRSPNPPD